MTGDLLHPDLQREEALSELQARWRERPNLRIAPFLREEAAVSLLAALQEQPFEIRASTYTDVASSLLFQFWQLAFHPEPECDHELCAFGRWMHGAAAGWVSRLTGLELAPPADGRILASLYSKGSYLEPHNDYDGQRAVAFVLGLTRETWPAEQGGHLEFLKPSGVELQVVERRPPVWNALDLFDVREPVHLHRIPIVREPVERRAVSGWFYPPPE